MPTVRPGYLADTPATNYGFGKSSSIHMKEAYGTSPLYTTYRDNEIRNTFNRPPEVTGPDGKRVLSDGGWAFGTVERDYQSAPSMSEVPTGGGGLPASPWGPNPNAPGAGNGHNYAAIPASTIGERPASEGAFIGTGRISPQATSRAIAPRLLGQVLQNGVGSGNSFKIRV